MSTTREMVQKIFHEMYPDIFTNDRDGIRQVPGRYAPTFTLNQMRLSEAYSEIDQSDVDLSVRIGPVQMKAPLLSAAMDSVSGPAMGKVMSEMGGAAIIWRTTKVEEQMGYVEDVLSHTHCMISRPVVLHPEDTMEDLYQIRGKYGFDTYPVIDDDGVLKGVVFYREVSIDDHLNDKVSRWMMPLGNLKTIGVEASFEMVKEVIDKPRCTILPAIDKEGVLKGLYFKKDFFNANPSLFCGKPLVGIAISPSESDIERVKAAIDAGVGIIVIDSSHGNSLNVIEQTRRVVDFARDRIAVIAGNIASIEGYLRLAETGVHAVKLGIGPGSACTTTLVTGVGFPMFTLIEQVSFAQKYLAGRGLHTPLIIADGGISGPGNMTVALARGADLCMAGEWLVASDESHSAQTLGFIEEGQKTFVPYWGMASKKAIRQRLSEGRYGSTKRAPEGVEKRVPYRGSLKKMLGEDFELLRGGFAHRGAKNICELHKSCMEPMAFVPFLD